MNEKIKDLFGIILKVSLAQMLHFVNKKKTELPAVIISYYIILKMSTETSAT